MPAEDEIRNTAPMRMVGPRGMMGWTLALSLACSACDEEPKPKETKAAEPAPPPAPPPTPKKKTAPRLEIDDVGPKVGFSRAMLTTPDGKPDTRGRQQLKDDLEEAKEFITGKEITLEVDRKAKPMSVAHYLGALHELKPDAVLIQTETRDAYPGKVEFLAQEAADPEPCTLVGTITEDRGTAIWRVSGGTARKRGRGMGGPDLTMTGDTITRMAKKCGSDLFVVTATEGIEWGLIYDLAASAMALEEAKLKRAVHPSEQLTAGHEVDL